MSLTTYYQQDMEKLEMYQRLIQYWSMIFDRRENIHVLDNMNFNINLFPEIFTMQDIASFHPIEPGYTSPDGYTELNELVRSLEYARLVKQAPERKETIQAMVSQAGVGCGNGCTNVMNGVIHSILKVNQNAERAEKPEVVLILPNYTVYTAQLSNLHGKVQPRYVYAQRENEFLPTFEEIKSAIRSNTMAVIITYPNNPAQSTYEGASVQELKKIVELCQENEIYLIVDNIYQDLVFPRTRPFTEIFNLTDRLDYVVKVYGCSKDTPFYSGYRTGYWFGDPKLMDKYRYVISATENSLNTQSLVYFALNLYCKYLELTQLEPAYDDMSYFSRGIFGWSQLVDKHRLFENMCRLELFPKYKSRIKESDGIQEQALKQVTEYVKGSTAFVDYTNQNIGNVFFIKMNPDYSFKSDDDLFQFLFNKAKCGVLPGNVFGMRQEAGEIWFRITLLHDNVENIMNHLGKIEDIFTYHV
ncbi:aminotransferase class I/II-fold pyridoxal phosphate-dependent enzyme [Caldalkalibacillus mannanilyticus]|uniref:aminotransferase class I/II-fold pyridoxal phosphate-dependent enzyme n=1 Tax=Caldalkalibacillus mannanilyticus TaxID=1418 RepID=UPI000469A690|nr:aminotransferase class I/II-fold pyridoxal phosphate-dependent enzyme [Caldalkalibacillus mannanilyticus]